MAGFGGVVYYLSETSPVTLVRTPSPPLAESQGGSALQPLFHTIACISFVKHFCPLLSPAHCFPPNGLVTH